MDAATRQQFDELCYYTLGHPDHQYFIHQHAVDALTAQAADENIKPIAITFAVIGLYLYVEKGYTGKQVQHMHVQFSRHKRDWTVLELPTSRGNIAVSDVLQAADGEPRDLMIRNWCASVWDAYQSWHAVIKQYVQNHFSSNHE